MYFSGLRVYGLYLFPSNYILLALSFFAPFVQACMFDLWQRDEGEVRVRGIQKKKRTQSPLCGYVSMYLCTVRMAYTPFKEGMQSTHSHSVMVNFFILAPPSPTGRLSVESECVATNYAANCRYMAATAGARRRHQNGKCVL